MTDWTIDHTPIHYGDSVIYAIVSDGNDQIANMKWEYACINTGCIGNFVLITNTTAGSINVMEGGYGNFQVVLTVSYQQNSGGGPARPNDVIRHTVLVKGPDDSRALINPTADTPYGEQTNESRFQLKADGADFLHGDGLAQERITKVSYDPTFDSGWVPAAATDKFFLENSQIVDMKSVGDPADTDFTTPDGGALYSYTQAFQVVVADCCGQSTTYPCGSYSVAVIKGGNQIGHFTY